jgi:tRNA(Ile)-lysidine synthase
VKSGGNSSGRAGASRSGDGMQARFSRACDLLALQLEQGPVVVAASGGADSAAALLLTRAVAPHARLVACYVDHGLRPRASIARDLEAVRAQARASRAEVIVCRLARARGRVAVGSPEERARSARYRALEATASRLGAATVISGHQRDDLVETSLLALARGSGIDGIAALRPKRALSKTVALARPLLWATKAECMAFVRAQGLAFSNDETNDDVRIPRNAVRELLERLGRTMPQASRNIARSAALLADDRALLEGMSLAALRQARAQASGELSTAALRRLPVSLLRRVVRAAVASIAGLRDFSFVHCDAIARAIKLGRGGRYHAGPATVVLSSGKLIVEPKAQAQRQTASVIPVDLTRLPVTLVTLSGTAELKVARRRSSRNGRALELDFDQLLMAGDVQLRAPRQGDTCIPSGRHRPVSLARFLAKAGVASTRRPNAAVLCAGGRIAAVLGVRVMEPFRAVAGKRVLQAAWRPADI